MNRDATSGVCGEGFRMTEFPAKRAGRTVLMAIRLRLEERVVGEGVLGIIPGYPSVRHERYGNLAREDNEWKEDHRRIPEIANTTPKGSFLINLFTPFAGVFPTSASTILNSR